MDEYIFKSRESPSLRVWCDDQRAEEMGVTEIDEVTFEGTGGIKQSYIQFESFRYVTDDETVAEYLRTEPRFGIDYVEMGASERDREWRDRLQADDKPDRWSDSTLNHFKSGGEVLRCEYGCGFASTTPQGIANHKMACPSKPTEEEES